MLAPVVADNRSLNCSGVGVTTPAIRFAAASISAAERRGSGPLPGVPGLWLSSADTDQWCHPAANSLHRGEHEDRNLPIGLLLVLGVVREGRHRALPPGGLLVAEYLARVVVVGSLAVLQLDPRVLRDVVIPDRVLWRPAQRRDDRVLAVMLDPHQRRLAKLAGLGAHRGQQNDGHALHIRGVGSTRLGILLGLFAGPIPRARGVFTFKWHVTTLIVLRPWCDARRVESASDTDNARSDARRRADKAGTHTNAPAVRLAVARCRVARATCHPGYTPVSVDGHHRSTRICPSERRGCRRARGRVGHDPLRHRGVARRRGP